MSDFYITTPIYYVNDRPHIGTAYPTVVADVLARAHRLLGDETWYLTGTDEHGLKVQQAAEKRGVTPEAHCDELVVLFKELWRDLAIANDDFIRTTEERHIRVVREVLAELWKRDEIYKAVYEGWYCTPCERYWTGKDLVEGRCADCHREVVLLKEDAYFFRMGKRRDWLVETIESHPGFIYPDYRRNEILGFLRQELGDLCISRSRERLSWGIPLPFDDRYVTYVWFDALLNYVSAIGYAPGSPDWRRRWSAAHHLIGKDIATTHCVYWPTMLHAMGAPLPRCIVVHGWWLNQEGGKMSKSKGKPADPRPLLERYGADAVRYYLLREMAIGRDAGFSEELFDARYNADLANDLGNLVSRSLTMVDRYSGGKVPGPSPSAGGEALVEACRAAAASYRELIESFRTHELLERIWAAVRAANRYVDDTKPWELAKQGATDLAPGGTGLANDRLGGVLYNLCETVRITAVMIEPVMPASSAEILRRLGRRGGESGRGFEARVAWGGLEPGTAIEKGGPLFPKQTNKNEGKA